MEYKEPKPKTCASEGCENQFKPRYRTTEKFCSPKCAIDAKKAKENGKYKRAKKYYIRPRTKKRSRQERLYLGKRIEFLSRKENQKCAVYPSKKATQVHHMRGRIGNLLTNESFWLAVSAEGHDYIEKNPEIAKEKGWSLSRLSVKI